MKLCYKLSFFFQNLIIELRSQLENDTSSSLHDDDGGYHVIVGSHGNSDDVSLANKKLKEKYREFDVSLDFCYFIINV